MGFIGFVTTLFSLIWMERNLLAYGFPKNREPRLGVGLGSKWGCVWLVNRISCFLFCWVLFSGLVCSTHWCNAQTITWRVGYVRPLRLPNQIAARLFFAGPVTSVWSRCRGMPRTNRAPFHFVSRRLPDFRPKPNATAANWMKMARVKRRERVQLRESRVIKGTSLHNLMLRPTKSSEMNETDYNVIIQSMNNRTS